MGFTCDCDYDAPSIYRETTQKARKEYHCSECHKIVHVGQEYVRIFGVWDGDASTFFRCERCDDLVAAFTGVGYCYEFGSFLSAYAEWLDDSGISRPKWLEDVFEEWRKKRAAV